MEKEEKAGTDQEGVERSTVVEIRLWMDSNEWSAGREIKEKSGMEETG